MWRHFNSSITKVKQVMKFKSFSAEHINNKQILEKFVSWPFKADVVCSPSVWNSK